MTIVNSIISRLTQLYSWLISRQWEREEVLIIVVISLFLLLLVLIARRKAKGRTSIPRYETTNATTIGVRLAHPAARQ